MRTTRRGLAVLIGSFGALAAGWVFALPEVFAAGAAGVVLVGATALAVRFRSRVPTVRRTARPLRLPVGDPCEIALLALHDRRSPSAVVALTDRVDGSGIAEVLLGPLRAGERAEATYSLPTRRRGVQRIGPLRTEVVDPFGLVRRWSVDERITAVVVLPRVVPLAPMPQAVGDEPELGARSMVAASTVDEDFTGLRGYVPGDDVRRIHWPSSARTGTAMVRQFEVPWQHRSTVLVDLRPSRHDPASFERTLTAAASAAALSARAGELLRFGTTLDRDPPFVTASDHFEALLDRLAVAEPVAGPGDDDALVDLIEHVTRIPTGRLVVCSGHLDAHELERVRGTAARAGFAVVVTTGEGSAAAESTREGRVHWVGDEADLARRWARALGVAPTPFTATNATYAATAPGAASTPATGRP